MPRYDFQCKKCGEVSEFEFKISELDVKRDKTKCPKCKGKCTLIIGETRFKLEGYGWYSDGYGITQTEMNKNLEDGCKADPNCTL